MFTWSWNLICSPLLSRDSLTHVDRGRALSYILTEARMEVSLMKIVIGLLLVVVLVVGVILALPFLIDLNKYQDQYKPLIEDALNRKVQLQGIRLTIWPRIGARVAGFVVLDDPAFGSSSFTSLTSLDIGVKLMPLLSGKVEVEDITLRNPVITVIKNKSGVLNVSTIGRTGVTLPHTPSRAPIPSTEGPLKILALLAVDRVSISGGTLTYRDLSAPEPTEYILQDMETPPPIRSARPIPKPPCWNARPTVESTGEA